MMTGEGRNAFGRETPGGVGGFSPGLFLQSVLPDLVKELPPTNAEELAGLGAVPVGLFQGMSDGPAFGFRQHLTQRHARRRTFFGRPGVNDGIGVKFSARINRPRDRMAVAPARSADCRPLPGQS